MPNGDDFISVLNPAEDDPMIATAQPEAALPFTMKRGNVANAEFSKSSERFENTESDGTIDCSQLRPCFGSEGETQSQESVEQFLDHLREIAAHNGVARVGLGQAATNGCCKFGTDRFLREDRQKALRSGYLRFGKGVDEFV